MSLTSLWCQLVFTTLLWGFTLAADDNAQHISSLECGAEPPTFSFSEHWQVLGPFQIGTREAVWGADPLEQFRGFSNLSFSLEQTYPSSLAPNASVRWSEARFKTSEDDLGAVVALFVNHDTIDWTFQQSIYGWAALQYQTWARGVIVNPDSLSQRVALYTTGVLELLVNKQHHFGGDLYGFERAPIILDLEPGNNTISVRLIGDVRANGGQIPPVIEVSIRATAVDWARQCVAGIAIIENSTLVPDLVDGKLVSHYASVILTNLEDDWFTIDSIGVIARGHIQVTIFDITLAPGQSRPFPFMLDEFSPFEVPVGASIQYSKGPSAHRLDFLFEPVQRDRYETQKVTFMHPSGAVSYAILRPPSQIACNQMQEALPVLVALHGAGLEADSYQVRHSFDAVPDLPAWLLFPTGMSPWSGDDWHTWGLSDVEAAIHAIPQWITTNNWSGPGAVIDRYVVCGHSNGGQGAWHLAQHQPDQVIAAAVASGYTSIEKYVPYVMWDVIDPRLDAILYSARISYKHELFFPNLATTPILIQHGQDDDNVPVYHGRLMKSLASRHNTKVKYVELPERGHWWDGAMVTDPLVEFYNEHVTVKANATESPETFNCFIGNSPDFGSCKGVVVDQLECPDTLASFQVTKSRVMNFTIWHMRTSNIHRFHLDFSAPTVAPPDAIKIDHDPTPFEIDDSGEDYFRRGHSGVWVRAQDKSWQTLSERHGRQRGPMDAVLRTQGPFQIVYDSDMAFSVALQISRNLLQYYGAAADLSSISESDHALRAKGNVIVVAVGHELPRAQLGNFPIEQRQGVIHVRQDRSLEYRPFEDATGAAFLRPLPDERLELVIWGTDEVGLRQAARMVPTLTGVGQPDFVILGESVAWEGVGGTLAMGFFDYSWNISAASYLPV